MSLAVQLPEIGTARAWRDAARACLAQGTRPEDLVWRYGEEGGDLFSAEARASCRPAGPTVPKSFVDLAETVVWHTDPERFARLYSVLWRLKDRPGLMADSGDPALSRLLAMAKAVRRCQHKMKAFVRFRDIGRPGAPRRSFAAWFEPTHHTVEPTAPFFARRFADMDWRIVTPDRTAVFEDGSLRFEQGRPRPRLDEDEAEALWATYFRNIFNPARLKVTAMRSEMPKKYWRNMPETRLIPELIAQAETRARRMREAGPTEPPVRASRIKAQAAAPIAGGPTGHGSLPALRQAARDCSRCPLHRHATQIVMGEGPQTAKLMVVGEQPGDREDLAGRPFVGPAGQLFDTACGDAGIDRDEIFVTNAVKHFKYRPRGKRRIHQRPNAGEIAHCRWWLDQERALVRPRLIVALGATAAEALTGSGRDIRTRRGGMERTADGTPVLLTVHPAFLLRMPDPAARAAEYDRFCGDLKAASAYLRDLRAG